jgi:hypothetical protein
VSISIAVEAMRWATPSPSPKLLVPTNLCPRIHLSLVFPLILPPLVSTTLSSIPRVCRTSSRSLIIVPHESLTRMRRPALWESSLSLSPPLIVRPVHAPSNSTRSFPLLAISEPDIFFRSTASDPPPLFLFHTPWPPLPPQKLGTLARRWTLTACPS